jgi:hypothetical protein
VRHERHRRPDAPYRWQPKPFTNTWSHVGGASAGGGVAVGSGTLDGQRELGAALELRNSPRSKAAGGVRYHDSIDAAISDARTYVDESIPLTEIGTSGWTGRRPADPRTGRQAAPNGGLTGRKGKLRIDDPSGW